MQDKSVLIYGATAHIGNGEAIKNSVVGFTDGVIDLVASIDGSWSNEKLKIFTDTNSKEYAINIRIHFGKYSSSFIYP